MRVLRIWSRDLQIFSLTLSQLSYLGSDEFLLDQHCNYNKWEACTDQEYFVLLGIFRVFNDDYKHQKRKKKWLPQVPRPIKNVKQKFTCLNWFYFLEKEKIWPKNKPRPGIIEKLMRVLRIWTRDIQIFSLTLSLNQHCNCNRREGCIKNTYTV